MLHGAWPTSAAHAASVHTALLALAVLSSPAVAQLPPSSGSASPLSATVRVTPLSETERAVHLLNRATYGARPVDVEEVLRVGRGAWLEVQLSPDSLAVEPDSLKVEPGLPEFVLDGGIGMTSNTLTNFKISRAAFSSRQLEEVMTDFWFNHFNVTGRSFIPNYEEHAIRRHVFGRFEDMLVATARHPAMLVYLDNYLSTIPNTDTIRGRGLNENYARELLELHTLGVDGGYTQSDVIEVARAFTGWGVHTRVRSSAMGPRLMVELRQTEMLFEPERHDQSSKLVMSLELPAGRGIEDGLDVLRMLARHPSTANHLATKLVTRFVSDEPPPQLVAELAGVFLATNGDLRAVTRALFTSELFFERAHYRSKAKRPFEFIVSTLRLTGTELEVRLAFRLWSSPPPLSHSLYQRLEQMRHVPYQAPAPTGYSSVAEDWISANSLLQRMTFAADLTASRLERGVTFDPSQALSLSISTALLSPGLDGVLRRESLPAMTDLVIGRLIPGLEAPELASAIVEDLSQGAAAYPGGLLSHAIALTLGSPHFQRY